MRHCEECGFLWESGGEYSESYCAVGVQEDDPKFDEDDKGCGCRYNLRTLRKMQDRLDHLEYLRYLWCDDFMLMPSIEYTRENQEILERHRKLMRHALGMDGKKPYRRYGKLFYKPYRNYFDTSKDTCDYPYWERLVKADLARKEVLEDGIRYKVTDRGIDWLGQHDQINIYKKRAGRWSF